MGIYGEGGFKLSMTSSTYTRYFWPGPRCRHRHPETARAVIRRLPGQAYHQKGIHPIFDAAGAITYEKRGLARSLVDKTLPSSTPTPSSEVR